MSNSKKLVGKLQSFQDLARKYAVCHQKALKLKTTYIVVLGILFVVFGFFACSCTDQTEKDYAKICDLGEGNSVWRAKDATSEKTLLLRTLIVGNNSSSIFGNDKKFKDEPLLPSKFFKGHYFYPSGNRFDIVKDKDDLFCFLIDDVALCGFEEVSNPYFLFNQLECGDAGLMFQIVDVLFWGKVKNLVVNKRDLKRTNNSKLIKYSGQNITLVFHNLDTKGPYAEVIGPHFVKNDPVFIGRFITKYEPGTPEVEISEYHFIWGDFDLLIDCKALSKSSVKPKENDVFVEVVKPFSANICARKLKIGLDSLTRVYTEKGKTIKKRTLYFSVQGQRYLATEWKEK